MVEKVREVKRLLKPKERFEKEKIRA